MEIQSSKNLEAIKNFAQVARSAWTPEDVRSGKAHHEYRKAERNIYGLGTSAVRALIFEARRTAKVTL